MFHNISVENNWGHTISSNRFPYFWQLWSPFWHIYIDNRQPSYTTHDLYSYVSLHEKWFTEVALLVSFIMYHVSVISTLRIDNFFLWARHIITMLLHTHEHIFGSDFPYAYFWCNFSEPSSYQSLKMWPFIVITNVRLFRIHNALNYELFEHGFYEAVVFKYDNMQYKISNSYSSV